MGKRGRCRPPINRLKNRFNQKHSIRVVPRQKGQPGFSWLPRCFSRYYTPPYEDRSQTVAPVEIDERIDELIESLRSEACNEASAPSFKDNIEFAVKRKENAVNVLFQINRLRAEITGGEITTDEVLGNIFKKFQHRKVDFAWESDFLQRKAYYLQIQLVNRIISGI